MKSVVFNTARESIHAARINYVGEIETMPEEKRKGDCTHYFRLGTRVGTLYCHYKSEESAQSARKAVVAKVMAVKPSIYSSNGRIIDPRAVVSFGYLFPLKKSQNGATHAFIVTMETADEKNNRIWLTFKSEEAAKKARIALFAAVHAVFGPATAQEETREEGSVAVKSDNLPF